MERLFQDVTIPKDPPTIQEILNSYDLDKLPSENISFIQNKFKRESLIATVGYIKTLQETFPTIIQRITQRNSRNKSDYAGDISIFIHGICPMKCQNCDDEYIHAAAVNSEGNSVSCFLCNRHSHKTCYADETEPKKGFHFICSICVEKAQQKAETLDTSLTQLVSQVETQLPPGQSQIPAGQPNRNTEKPASYASSDSFHNHSSATNADDEDRRGTERKKSDEKICPMYMENTCPHGISGKGCSFKHPPRCFRYSKHGEDRWKGCTRGSRCWYFHPRLCQNSVTMKICLTKTCKEVHLIGTTRERRFKPRDNNYKDPRQHTNSTSDQQTYSQSYQQRGHQSTQPHPWSQPEVSNETESQNNQSDAQRTNHFLLQYLESMKADLTKSIELKIESALQSRVPVRENQPQQVMQPQVTPQQPMQAPTNPQIPDQNSQINTQLMRPVSPPAPDYLQQHNQYIPVHPHLLNQYTAQLVPGQRM